ncbi:MAG: LCP family protein [Herpetosiphon sp.]
MGLVGYYIYSKTFGVLASIKVADVVPTPEGSSPPVPLLSQPFNVLLIGIDLRREHMEDGARSDTLIVVRVDPAAKKATMLSVPRDTFVDIAGPTGDIIQTGKINSAYSYGFGNPNIYAGNTDPFIAGGTLARQTVERFLGIQIPYYAQIDFQGFQKFVDGVGGVTLDVPRAVLDAEYPTEDDGYMRLYIPPGLQHMDGTTALRYARTRHTDDDFGRGKRQQQVIQAIVTELKQRGVLGKLDALPALADAVRESVKTNLPVDDLATIKGLAQLGQQLTPDRVSNMVLEPGTSEEPHIVGDYGSDIHWVPAYISKMAAQFQKGREAASQTIDVGTVQVQNGKGVKNLAHDVTLELQLGGFKTIDPVDAPKGQHPHTIILDYTGKAGTAQRLASLFHVAPQYIKDMTAKKADAPLGVDIVLLVGDDYRPPSVTEPAKSKRS